MALERLVVQVVVLLEDIVSLEEMELLVKEKTAEQVEWVHKAVAVAVLVQQEALVEAEQAAVTDYHFMERHMQAEAVEVVAAVVVLVAALAEVLEVEAMHQYQQMYLLFLELQTQAAEVVLVLLIILPLVLVAAQELL